MFLRYISYISRAKLTLKKDPVLVMLLLSSAAYFFFYYLTDPARPAGVFSFIGLNDKALYEAGWFGYYDQSQYLRLAQTLANFDFQRLHETYTYGIGYPLVAVPFLWLGIHSDPFVFFNFATFLFTVFAVYKAAKHFISPLAGWLAGFGLVFATPLINYVDIPWNSTICLLAMAVILLAATAKKVTRWHALVVGLLIGWSFAARYVDIFWLTILGVSALYRGALKPWVKSAAFMVVGMGLFIVPVMYSHYKYFGSPLRTPYVNHLGIGGVGSSDQGAGAYNLSRVPNASLGMLVSPRLAGSIDYDRGLLISMFWVIAAIPGAVILLRRNTGKLFWKVFIVTTSVAFIFYLSFRASTPDSIKYGTLHYFKIFWPGMVILAVAFLDSIIGKLALSPTAPKGKKQFAPNVQRRER
ncbi:MAG: hypothetical protein JWO35_151 [Candidatus Saccharibacteria bacterium]|nr:hypothetical protein [Candidatus Saccharibacteria bacterium]